MSKRSPSPSPAPTALQRKTMLWKAFRQQAPRALEVFHHMTQSELIRWAKRICMQAEHPNDLVSAMSYFEALLEQDLRDDEGSVWDHEKLEGFTAAEVDLATVVALAYELERQAR